jgi:hypothetical protein
LQISHLSNAPISIENASQTDQDALVFRGHGAVQELPTSLIVTAHYQDGVLIMEYF